MRRSIKIMAGIRVVAALLAVLITIEQNFYTEGFL